MRHCTGCASRMRSTKQNFHVPH